MLKKIIINNNNNLLDFIKKYENLEEDNKNIKFIYLHFKNINIQNINIFLNKIRYIKKIKFENIKFISDNTLLLNNTIKEIIIKKCSYYKYFKIELKNLIKLKIEDIIFINDEDFIEFNNFIKNLYEQKNLKLFKITNINNKYLNILQNFVIKHKINNIIFKKCFIINYKFINNNSIKLNYIFIYNLYKEKKLYEYIINYQKYNRYPIIKNINKNEKNKKIIKKENDFLYCIQKFNSYFFENLKNIFQTKKSFNSVGMVEKTKNFSDILIFFKFNKCSYPLSLSKIIQIKQTISKKRKVYEKTKVKKKIKIKIKK